MDGHRHNVVLISCQNKSHCGFQKSQIYLRGENFVGDKYFLLGQNVVIFPCKAHFINKTFILSSFSEDYHHLLCYQTTWRSITAWEPS